MYDSGMTSREIGVVVNIPFRTVLRYLKAAGVVVRNTGAPHSPKLDDVEYLKASYEKGFSTTQIAEEIGSTASTVSKWMRRHGIEMRSCGSEKGHNRNTAEARLKMSQAKRGRLIGDKNPNWRGGNSSVDPDRNRYKAKKWSADVKARDSFACIECGETEMLHSHHVKSWKHYPELRYDLDNGVTLCETCHQQAHKFRFPWVDMQKSPRVHRP